jgi:hypothetical protein
MTVVVLIEMRPVPGSGEYVIKMFLAVSGWYLNMMMLYPTFM